MDTGTHRHTNTQPTRRWETTPPATALRASCVPQRCCRNLGAHLAPRAGPPSSHSVLRGWEPRATAPGPPVLPVPKLPLTLPARPSRGQRPEGHRCRASTEGQEAMMKDPMVTVGAQRPPVTLWRRRGGPGLGGQQGALERDPSALPCAPSSPQEGPDSGRWVAWLVDLGTRPGRWTWVETSATSSPEAAGVGTQVLRCLLGHSGLQSQAHCRHDAGKALHPPSSPGGPKSGPEVAGGPRSLALLWERASP